MRRSARVRAPEFTGRSWLGTQEPLTVAGLRGRFLLLDFWTFCCVNCLHVLEELRPLEEQFVDVLTVVGVHSPKFVHEADPVALAAAVERYGVHHPVLDDPDLTTWKQYAVRAWPTLVLVDPEGYVVHVASGEGHAAGIGRLLEQLVAEHDAKGTLHRGAGHYVPVEPTVGELSFPGKAVRLGDGRLAVSDSGHDSVVVLSGYDVVERFGGFLQPQGMCLLPDGRLLVADTGHHLLRTLDLSTGEVRTVAGTGQVWRPGDPSSGPALEVNLSTPWDVAVFDGEVVVAMAGTHQLHAFDGTTVRVLAGTTGEGLRDGAAGSAYLAQPSGLGGRCRPAVVRGLRDVSLALVQGRRGGHRGRHGVVRLRPPRRARGAGAAAAPAGRDGPPGRQRRGLRHLQRRRTPVRPRDLHRDHADGGPGRALGRGRRRRPPARRRVGGAPRDEGATAGRGARGRRRRPPDAATGHGAGSGPGRAGRGVHPAAGAEARRHLWVVQQADVGGSGLEVQGAGTTTDLTRSLVLRGESGVLHVAASAASCDVDAEHAACHVTQQDWGIPVRLVPGAPTTLTLVLNGMDET